MTQTSEYTHNKSNMTISTTAITLIKQMVPFSLYAQDKEAQALNYFQQDAFIGYSHRIENVQEFELYAKGFDEFRAQKLLELDVARICKKVNSLLYQDLSQSQFDALVLFALDIGRQAFVSSTVLKLVNDPATASVGFENLEKAWKAWCNPMTSNRREVEWHLFSQGEYHF